MTRTRKPLSKTNLQERFFSIGKLVLLSGILVTVFVFGLILGMRFAVQGKVQEAPALVGMSLKDAEELFERMELSLQVGGHRYDADVPEGAIIQQYPGPGVGIKSNRNVQVIVSLGRRTNPIPQLVGVSLRAARLLAEQNGFQIGKISEIDLSGEKDIVLAQSPGPGMAETVTDQIDVLVRREKEEEYVMPELVGMNLNRVLVFLKEHEFETKVFYRDHPQERRGTVVRQFPEPGYRLVASQVVNLEVAM